MHKPQFSLSLLPLPGRGWDDSVRELAAWVAISIGGTAAQPVADIAALKAVAPRDREDKQCRYVEVAVEAKGAWYAFDAQSVEAESLPKVVAPTSGTGRWLLLGDTPHTHVEANITDLDKYTMVETNDLLAGKADVDHNHDQVYEKLLFVSSEQTGNGIEQSIAHGLGRVPTKVLIVPTDTSTPADGKFTITEGVHTDINILATVTNTVKYKVMAV